MAEIFGIVAGAAGIVPLITQIVTGVKTLRRIRSSVDNAPVQFDELIGDLEFLQHALQGVVRAGQTPGHGGSSYPFILQKCRQDCSNVSAGLETLQRRFPLASPDPPDASPAGKLSLAKAKRLVRFRDWEEEVQTLQKSVDKAKQNLLVTMSLMSISWTHRTFDPRPETKMPPDVPKLQASPDLPDTAEAYSQTTEEIAELRLKPRLSRHRNDCSSRHCSCRCHRIGQVRRRFWSLDYTPLAIILQGCDEKDCSAQKYSISFRIALTQLGFPIATILQLQYLDNGGGFSISPALRVQHVVRNTSRGFELLWLCETGRISLEETIKGFREMYQSNKAQFLNHVSAEGSTYVQEVARRPWWPDVRDGQFTLLQLFMCEFGMEGGTHDIRFLQSSLSGWIGEGPHIDLYESLLDNGWEVGELDHPHAEDWPKPCDPNWLAEELIPDPLFVKLLATLARESPGYAGITPAHHLVLSESAGVDKLLRAFKHPPGSAPANFLNQTPLHFAATTNHRNTKAYIEALLTLGCDINAEDIYGMTPLMYAATMNSKRALTSLLEAGSHITRDRLWGRNFMGYAIARHNWDILIAGIDTISRLDGLDGLDGHTVASLCAHHAAVNIVVKYRRSSDQGRILRYLFAKMEDVNIVFSNKGTENDSLMHHVQTLGEAEALVSLGFVQFNRANSIGHLPIMDACRYIWEPDVVEFLLKKGANSDLTDSWGHTTLLHVLARHSHGWGTLADSHWKMVNTVLRYSQNFPTHDACSCPCSEGGCTQAIALGSKFRDPWGDWGCPLTRPLFTLEWVIVLLEERGEPMAKAELLSLIRRTRFADLSLQHTCCQRFSGARIFGKDWESLKDPLDRVCLKRKPDEDQAVAALESSMKHLAHGTVDELFNEWIQTLARSYAELSEPISRGGTKDAPGDDWKSSYFVDYRSDEFVEITAAPREPSLAEKRRSVQGEIASYTLWVERSYARDKNQGRNAQDSAAGYKRRIDCILKLSRWTVGIEVVAKELMVVDRKEPELEGCDREACKRHFLEFAAKELAGN